MGHQYEGAAPLIRLYGIAALSNSLLSLWIAYFVGRGWMLIGTVIALAVVAELVLLLTRKLIALRRRLGDEADLASFWRILVLKVLARFRRLTGGSKSAMPRHQTLQATIGWSYDTLPAERSGDP